jgi:hypothetical protein
VAAPLIVPVVDEGPGNSSYLVDPGDGRALAIDAPRDLRAVRAAARRHRLAVAFAADTHLHADFLSGARQLAADDGAQILAPAAGGRAFDHRGLADGGEADLGGLTLRAWATPAIPPITWPTCCWTPAGAGRVHRGVAAGRRGGPHRPGRPGPDRAAGPGAVRVPAAAARPARRDAGVPDARGGVVLLVRTARPGSCRGVPMDKIGPDSEDGLSSILREVNVRSAVYCLSDFSAPWGFRVENSPAAKFHVILHGAAWLSIGNMAPVSLRTGDLVLLPSGHGHTVADEPGSPARDLDGILAEHRVDEAGRLAYGGDGAPARLLCGGFELRSALTESWRRSSPGTRARRRRWPRTLA